MSNAGDKNLEIIIGDTFSKSLTIKDSSDNPFDLTGYSFKAQIRKCKNSSSVILEFISPTTINITLASIGQIILTASAASTGALAEQNGVYDLYWTDPSGNVRTILEGSVQIIERVTKP